MLDHRLAGKAPVVGYWMGDCITMEKTEADYKETGDIVIFPSQQELVEKTGFHIETVAAGVANLIKRGHLFKLKQGNQRTGSNRYLVIVKPLKSTMSI